MKGIIQASLIELENQLITDPAATLDVAHAVNSETYTTTLTETLVNPANINLHGVAIELIIFTDTEQYIVSVTHDDANDIYDTLYMLWEQMQTYFPGVTLAQNTSNVTATFTNADFATITSPVTYVFNGVEYPKAVSSWKFNSHLPFIPLKILWNDNQNGVQELPNSELTYSWNDAQDYEIDLSRVRQYAYIGKQYADSVQLNQMFWKANSYTIGKQQILPIRKYYLLIDELVNSRVGRG